MRNTLALTQICSIFLSIILMAIQVLKPVENVSVQGQTEGSAVQSTCYSCIGPRFSSQHPRWLTVAYNFSSRASKMFFWPLLAPAHTSTYTHTHTIYIYTHTHILSHTHTITHSVCVCVWLAWAAGVIINKQIIRQTKPVPVFGVPGISLPLVAYFQASPLLALTPLCDLDCPCL